MCIRDRGSLERLGVLLLLRRQAFSGWAPGDYAPRRMRPGTTIVVLVLLAAITLAGLALVVQLLGQQ